MGPYYYENIRGRDGKVKSVYIGKQHPKKEKLDKRLIISLIIGFLIVMPVYFFIENNIQEEIDKTQNVPAVFDVDQIMIKTLLKTGEHVISPIRIMNIGAEDASINIELMALEDLISFSEKNFVMAPGQTKIVYLNFSAKVPKKNVEYSPDVYVGKLIVESKEHKKEIAVIVEIESSNVLFDMNLNIPPEDREIKQGGAAIVEIRLFNLKGTSPVNIEMYYFVKDLNGNVIITESETAVVTTQASFFKTIKIPENLREGEYVFAAKAQYASSLGTASYLFDVIKPAEAKKSIDFFRICKSNAMCWVSVFAAMVMIFSIGAYIYFLVGAWFFSKFYGKAKIESADIISKKAESPSQKIAKAYKRLVLWLILILITILIIRGIYSYLKKEGIELIKSQLSKISTGYIVYFIAVITLILIVYYIHRKKERISRTLREWKIRNEKRREKKIKEKESEERRRERERKTIRAEKRRIAAEKQRLKELKEENELEEKRKNEQRKRRERLNKQNKREKSIKEEKHKQIINHLLLILNRNIKAIEKCRWVLEKDDENLVKNKERKFKKIEIQLGSDEEHKARMDEITQRVNSSIKHVKKNKLGILVEIKELQRKYDEYKIKSETIRADILKRIGYIRRFERKLIKEEEKRKVEEERRKIEYKRERKKEKERLRLLREKEKKKKKGKRKKELVKKFFHKAGLYKTKSEKKEIKRRKEEERKRIERLKEEGIKKKKLFELRKAEEKERKKKERNIRMMRKAAERNRLKKEKEKIKKIMEKERIERAKARKAKIIDLLHKTGLYKTKSEKKKRKKLLESRKAAERSRLKKEKEKIKKLREREKREKEKNRTERAKAIKTKIRAVLHEAGIYKTESEKTEIKRKKELVRKRKEEERKRIESEREKLRIDKEKEKLRRLRENGKGKEEERKREEVERKKEQEEKERIRKLREKEREEERKREEVERKKEQEEKERIRKLREKEREEERKREEVERKKEQEEKERIRKLREREKEEERKLKQSEIKERQEEIRKIKEFEEKRRQEIKEKQEQKRAKNIKKIEALEKKIGLKEKQENKLRTDIKKIEESRGLILDLLRKTEQGWEEKKKKDFSKLEGIKKFEENKRACGEDYKNKIAQLKNQKNARLSEIENQKKIFEMEKKNFEQKVKEEAEKEAQNLSAKERKEMEKWKSIEIAARNKIKEKRILKLEKSEIRRFEILNEKIEDEYRKKKSELKSNMGLKDIEKEKRDIKDRRQNEQKERQELFKKDSSLINKRRRLYDKINQIREEKERIYLEIKVAERELIKTKPSFFRELRGYLKIKDEERKKIAEETRENEERVKKEIERAREKERIKEEKEKSRLVKLKDVKIERKKETAAGGFLQKLGFLKTKKEGVNAEAEGELKEKQQKEDVKEELESLEEYAEKRVSKGSLKERINEFNDLLKEIDKNIKNMKIKEAASLYITLRQMYDAAIKDNIGEVGENIIYNKINQAYEQLKKARKQ